MGGILDNVLTDTYDYEQELDATCTIRRNTPGAADSYNQPAAVWANLATNVPCKITEVTNYTLETKGDKQVVLCDYLIFFKITQDITEKDRIVITINSVSQTCEVIFVADAAGETHHKEVAAKLIKV